MAPVIVYHDILDREIRQETLGFDGDRIFTDRGYNNRGEVARVSEPYFEGAAPLWTVSEHDDLGRLTRLTAPGGRVSSTDYAGLTTTVTNPLGQTSTRVPARCSKVLHAQEPGPPTMNLSHGAPSSDTKSLGWPPTPAPMPRPPAAKTAESSNSRALVHQRKLLGLSPFV